MTNSVFTLRHDSDACHLMTQDLLGKVAIHSYIDQ